ncbi:flagellar hook-associated protein FlgK [Sporosarcina thermotolerans]|uniref:Flagellar hook-associated protein 1 n=1 Tax=Sporosarcina thermotolerans TaxID=633404 RepID=A0AAW9A7G3_9BACL|nr:flagellar hook-associated protein FlgK [Sporosarcina thermotolerans]MDW0116939.1 flagellar hook-associated protein FlgK [Sporosarcina thermotolerans]WHT47945.1 flagellar hook-associated protein FlgK [Sporosarcina thermotolerans]
MRSTFMGLETNKRGLYAQQTGLYTTGNNISNANSLGYTRTRVNMQATQGLTSSPGLLGTGVEASSIQRIRDSFVDNQFRQESNTLGYWESRSNAISQIEDIIGEPSEFGLQKSLSEFWSSLQTLATSPSSSGARAIVIQRGQDVAESFNHLHSSLTEAQTNLGKEISFSTDNVNFLLEEVARLNGQISGMESGGYLPNELYDQRDLLLDELSTYLPIETKFEKTGGGTSAIAQGTVTVSLKMNDGVRVELVKGKEFGEVEVNPTNQLIQGISIKAVGDTDSTNHVLSEFLDSGKLKSLINSYGYGTGDGNGLYPDMINNLNKMAEALANEFNRVHGEGIDLDGNDGEAFFVITTAGNLSVNQDLIDDPRKLAASGSADEIANADNAKALLAIQTSPLDDLNKSTIQDFFSGIIGKLGVNGQQAQRMAFNTASLQGAAANRRDSISAVSLDEEMTDMIRFQQAYNASARMITVIDETLDKIINGMGLSGR